MKFSVPSIFANSTSYGEPFQRPSSEKELLFASSPASSTSISDKIAARFVGGCVRKYLSNEKIDDIDVATILTTDQIKEKFKDSKFKVLDTGIKHGTVTIISDNYKVELTTLRKDSYFLEKQYDLLEIHKIQFGYIFCLIVKLSFSL